MRRPESFTSQLPANELKLKGMELKRKPLGNKVYRGAYTYYKGNTLYAEEEFEAYRDRKEFGMNFFASLHARVSTGELLNIYVDYTLTRDYLPQKLLIEKSIGNSMVTEVFDFNPQKNIVDYIFISSSGKKHIELQVPPKFGITTPTTSTALLFIKCKREDSTAKNFYQVLSSTNQWTFEKGPIHQNIVTERLALSAENITLEGQSLSATPYKIWDSKDLDKDDEANKSDFISVQLSRHSTIAYMVKSSDGTRVQIKYLNDLDKE